MPHPGRLIQANWDDVVDATRYSVKIVATYDTGIIGHPTDDTSMDWDFGTGDRTDGFPIGQSDLMIPLSGLNHDFGTGAGPQPAIPERATNVKITGFLIFCTPAAAPAA